MGKKEQEHGNRADIVQQRCSRNHKSRKIDGMLDRIEEEMGPKLHVIATGGLAKALIPYCRHEITLDDALLLKGLKIIYEKNK